MERIFGAMGRGLWIMAAWALVASATVACGSAPPDPTLQDGAEGTSSAAAAPTTESTAEPYSAPRTAECGTEQGCPCAHEREAIACKGPMLRDGDYVTCEGFRVCFHGAWGPCLPPALQTSGGGPH